MPFLKLEGLKGMEKELLPSVRLGRRKRGLIIWGPNRCNSKKYDVKNFLSIKTHKIKQKQHILLSLNEQSNIYLVTMYRSIKTFPISSNSKLK